MRRRWSQIAGAAVALIATLIVLLLNNQLRQGEQATATLRPATALAAAPSASAAATATRLPATTAAAATAATTTATRSAPATATRTAASATATATSAIRNPQSAIPPTPTPDSKTATIALAKLPPEAQQTIRLIDQGGPFPYDRDGIVFGNRERLLPLQAEGYYHEYTVITPGSADRGERRIIAGSRGELYYTDDHYESFRRVIR